jgi:hypothetical protein
MPIDASQEKVKARIDNNEKFEVIRDTLISRVVICQARTVCTQAEMKAKMDVLQEKMEAAIHSIWSKLEETMKRGVEDILLCVWQKMRSLCKELNEKIDETQMDLQVVESPSIMRAKSFQETLADTGNDIHKELGLMFQVEAQKVKAEIRINQERMEAKIEAT